ncbi:MAG: hypothetical protein ACR2Q4_02860 [Geminicoccaceae bacterium]
MPWIHRAGMIIVLGMAVGPACADELGDDVQILDHQLDNIESRTLQRPTGQGRTSDLLVRQDLRVSEQRMKTLKTRTPRDTRLPLLERQLDRAQRPTRRTRR